MPRFQINDIVPEGHFKLVFEQDKRQDFYGRALSEFDIFRRYGALPDNGVVVNKLINIIGNNLLRLEEKKSTLRQSKLPCDKDTLFYTRLEAWSSALTVDILADIAPLEQRGDTSAFCEKIQALYDNYMTQLGNLGGDYQDGVKLDRLLALQDTLLVQRSKWEKRLTDKKLTHDSLRELYQVVLDDFNQVQRQITLYQRHYLGAAVFANESATQAYQDASYALESHLFSVDEPKDGQLWIEPVAEGQSIVISTEHMPSIRGDWALKAGIAVGVDYSRQSASLPMQYLALKEEIKNSNLEVKSKKSQGERDFSHQQPIDSVSELLNFLITQSIQGHAMPPQEKNSDAHAIAFLLGTPSEKNEKMLLERPVHHFPCTDIFSSLGACFSLLKFLESEVTAKHPVVTTSVFLTSALTFTSAGLASIGIAKASMEQLLHVIAECLTLKGHIGLSAAQMQGVIETINKLLMSREHGYLIEMIIKNGFVLPTLLTTAADFIVNGAEGKDIVTTVLQQNFVDDLEGKTTATVVQEVITKILLSAIALSAAYGIEVALISLNSIIGTAAQTQFLVGVLAMRELGYYRHAVHDFLSLVAEIVEEKESPEKFQSAVPSSLYVLIDAIYLIHILHKVYKDHPEKFQRFLSQYALSDVIRKDALENADFQKFLKETFYHSPAFLMQLGLPYPTKPRFLGWAARGLVGGVFGLLLVATVVVPLSLLLSLVRPDFETWLNENTEYYTGRFFKDVFNIALSCAKYAAGLCIAIWMLIPAFIFPPLIFFKPYQNFLFSSPARQEGKDGRYYFQELEASTLIVKHGVMGAARFITTGIGKKILYPLYGFALMLLATPLMLINILAAMIVRSFPGIRFSFTYRAVMQPTSWFVHSQAVREGLKIPLIMFPRLFMFAWIPLKLVAMAISEVLIHRLPMIMLDGIFNFGLMFHALVTRNDEWLGLKALGSLLSKFIYYPLGYLPLYIGAQLKAFVVGLVEGVRGEYGFLDEFAMARKASLKDAWVTQVRELYHEVALNLQAVKGAHKIVHVRDKALQGYSSVYLTLKGFFSRALKVVRDFCLRRPEEMLQKEEAEEVMQLRHLAKASAPQGVPESVAHQPPPVPREEPPRIIASRDPSVRKPP